MANGGLAFRVDIAVTGDMVTHILSHLALMTEPAALADFLDDRVDPWLRARTANRFAGEGDDVTGPWAPLRPATESIRAAKGFTPSHPINVRSSMMKDFLVGTPGDVKQSGIGATLIYPGPVTNPLTEQKIATAQKGKSYPQTQPRPVLGVNENDLMFIQNELVQHLFGGL